MADGDLQLPIAGRQVSMVGIAAYVPLLRLHFWVENVVDPDYVLYVDGPFRLSIGGQEHVVAPPEGPNPLYLTLVGKHVAGAVASQDGGLKIEFADGDSLTVEPDEYEPWQLEGDDGYMLISVAGGGLAEVPPEEQVELRR